MCLVLCLQDQPLLTYIVIHSTEQQAAFVNVKKEYQLEVEKLKVVHSDVYMYNFHIYQYISILL